MDKRVLAAVLVMACAPPGDHAQTRPVAFMGATVWDGTGAPVLEDATILVDEGRIVDLGQDLEVPAGARTVSLAGRYVIPGLIDTHSHVTGAWAPDEITDPAERILGDLRLYARYGITTVNSLGDGEVVLAVRDRASPTDLHSRLLAGGEVVVASDPAGARAAASTNADAGVDFLKLRVDDNLGAGQKMPWDAVAAVMDVGRERGIPVATHMFYLDDAKRLLAMGSGMLAHSVRDTAVDQELIALLRERGVCYVPTLVREVSTFVYADRPEWFDDPFFVRYADRSEMDRVSQPEYMERVRQSASAAAYRVGLEQAQRNLKTLVDAGIPVAMGTDAGPAGRFPGFFSHEELSLMAEAGLTPEQILGSATAVAAECLGLDEVGTLEPGRWADFLVLEGNPLEDVEATRTLETVYVAGTAMD